MKFQVPGSLKSEHDELHDMLREATRLSGKTGEAARKVAELMHPHFIKEEEYALPPLGLLPEISSGSVSEEMKEVIPLTDMLKDELPEMLEEHRQITEALKVLIHHATAENHHEVVNFAEKLILHAKTEEEVSYPTSILIGEIIKLNPGLKEKQRILVEQFYNAVINKGDTRIMSQIMNEDFTDHNSSPEFRHGLEGFSRFLNMVGTAFPDIHVKIEDIISEGNKAAVRLTITGTHTGVLMGSIPPSGKKAVWTGTDILTIVEGKISERWSQRDLLGMMQQVGAVPARDLVNSPELIGKEYNDR